MNLHGRAALDLVNPSLDLHDEILSALKVDHRQVKQGQSKLVSSVLKLGRFGLALADVDWKVDPDGPRLDRLGVLLGDVPKVVRHGLGEGRHENVVDRHALTDGAANLLDALEVNAVHGTGDDLLPRRRTNQLEGVSTVLSPKRPGVSLVKAVDGDAGPLESREVRLGLPPRDLGDVVLLRELGGLVNQLEQEGVDEANPIADAVINDEDDLGSPVLHLRYMDDAPQRSVEVEGALLRLRD